MTITVERESKTIKQKTIEVPAYYKYGMCRFKVLSEADYIEVASDDEERGIKKKSIKGIVGLIVYDGEKITESEFQEAYSNALTELVNYQPEPVSV